jgi:glycosyltransferase involved in cell wall biosynthesis
MLETGFKRQLLMLTERLTYMAATEVWPNSRSMMDFITSKKLSPLRKLKVIGNGSTNGVDLKKFTRQHLNEDTTGKIKASIPAVAGTRILCVGRMVKDKGIEELVAVFQQLQEHYSLQLILVGPFEPHLDPLSVATMDIIASNPAIVHVGWSDAVEYYMSLADIFVHPSHREGFPNVILQAGAMQLPVVCSRIPGNADIVEHEKTGLLFDVNNRDDLYAKLKFAIENKELTAKRARTLYEEVVQLYNRERIHEVILNSYNSLSGT